MSEIVTPPGMGNLESWPDRFVGREVELARLDDALTSGRTVVVAAVHGLGGVGKSSLAAYWAGTRAHGLGLVVWIRADSRAGVEQGLAAFATRLQPALAEVLTVEALVERGLQWLGTHTGWLLILDNVENPADIAVVRARARGGRIIVTGRLSMLWPSDAAVISLDVLDADDAEELLTGLVTAAGPRNLDGAADLCEALGYLPLAINQAGAYLAHQRFTTPRAYLQLLNDQPGPTLDCAATGTDAERTITRIWCVTLDRIAETEPYAVELLRILAWYAPDNVPLTLCRDETDQARGDAAIGMLLAYNMITADPAGESVSIHRLVQAVSRTPDPLDPHRDGVAIERAHATAIDAMWRALPDHKKPGSWPVWRNLLPHIIALERTLDDRERLLGGEHPRSLAFRENLAFAYESAGQTGEVISLFERTLVDLERQFGAEHAHTLTFRKNLADAYWSAGRTDEAIEQFERILADRERVLGDDHPDTVKSRENLAHAYTNNLKAAGLYERILADRERLLGAEHPDTLRCRDNLASAYFWSGRRRDAVRMFKQILADRERLLGDEHPDTLESRRTLYHYGWGVRDT
ncbi:hypothetical protein CH305_00685 [Rhodococcus sp. 15-649-2-2]|uniref:tetratricopeptide repeat protein n=1 Tax=Rhodococcus sp. 15-649-2-2 TaxID=2023140 RepID=UPI000B9BA076|nr:tetratricopeptide repeat protein [Rhodococcus sp. 15-649-2-2]OZE88386.1 hypothetical protein CH305_00685 [Rhodococcus sp. 15-649-2-2]